MPNELIEPDDTLLYDIAGIRAIEHAALATLPAGTLMRRAGAATAALAQTLMAQRQGPVLIVAGPGNNGGDALEAAVNLRQNGLDVRVLLLADAARLPADAVHALIRARESGVDFIELSGVGQPWALALDGLFGIGLARAPAGDFRRAITLLNELDCPVLAIDVPSGLDADTGAEVGGGPAVRADHTITFIADKPGLHTAHGRDCAGTVHLERLAIAPALYGPALASLITPASFRHVLRPRPHASHKGSFGDLTIIGGSTGMAGAVVLAARMGAMAGAGRVFAAFANASPSFDPMHPELMCRDARTIRLDHGAAVIGPGLGTAAEATELLSRAIASALPLVMDADALNLLAHDGDLRQRTLQRLAPTLVTPHPLEAARLLGTDASTVQADRLNSALAIAAMLGAQVILKGSGSVVASPDGTLLINPTGNPALATAGSGDVLSGLCGALLAQQVPVHEAALAATWLHGRAADHLVEQGVGPIGLTASELPAAIRATLNQLSLPDWKNR